MGKYGDGMDPVSQRSLQALDDAGITDSELASSLGVSRAAIGNWRARASVPHAQVCAIALAARQAGHHVTADWIWTGVDTATDHAPVSLDAGTLRHVLDAVDRIDRDRHTRLSDHARADLIARHYARASAAVVDAIYRGMTDDLDDHNDR